VKKVSQSFRRTLRDTVSLIKANGQRYNNIKAFVQPNMIFIADASLPIEEGDKLTRELPNGLEESYLVLDRGYYSPVQGMDAHYQVKVRKETTISRRQPTTTIGTLVAGDQINLSDIQQSSVSIKSRLENASQSIGSLTSATQSERDEVAQLVDKLSEALQQVPSDKKDEALKVLRRLEILLEDTSSGKPDKDRIEITGESLILAAKNLATVAPFVLTVATQVVDAISRMLP
jgi:ElaB/YqjD/DUF883 family membrane-anchored ribosome-binding protein